MTRLIATASLTCLLLVQPMAANDAAKNPQSHPGGPPTTLPASLIASLETHENVVYAKYGDRELALDLYRPKSAGDRTLPAIVCIHGGGWWQGNRTNHARIAQALAARGYVAATISYRLSDEAPFPAQIHDCKAAVRFLRAEADTYGIAPAKIGAIGLSAGGHLTALLGTSGGVPELEGDGGHADQSSAIQAAVPMGAQTNFRTHHENIERSDAAGSAEKLNIWVQFLGGKPSEKPEAWRLASPITHLDANDPPMHFITGALDNDTTHAELFRNRMREFGIPEALTVIPNAPHPFPGRQKFFDQAINAAAAWFEKHLN